MADALLEKYDLYYVSPSAAKMGFMLAKNAQGVKAWERRDERGLPESFAPGDIGYANLSPDIQKVIAHSFYHGGLGALEFEVEEDSAFQILRYLRSQDVDLRCKGKAYPGPKILTISPAVSGAWVSPTSHGDPSSHWNNEANAYDNNTATKANSVLLPFGWSGYLELNIGAITTNKIRYYISRSYTSVERLSVDVYYSGAWHEIYTGAGTWDAWAIVEIGSSQSVTAGRIRVYAGSGGLYYAYLHEFAFAQSGIAGADAIFNDKYYKVFGSTLAKLNTGTQAFDDAKTFNSDISYIETFLNNLLVALGRTTESNLAADITDIATSMTVTTGDGVNFPGINFYFQIENEIVKVTNVTDDTFTIVRAQWGTSGVAHSKGVEVSDVYKYWYMDKDENFTESTITNGEADRFCKVGAALYQLKLPNKIRKSTDPTNAGSWGSEVKVGEAAHNINDMKEYLELLYCEKEDGIYYLDASDNVKHPFGSLATIAHSDSGKNSDVFRNRLYFRMGNQQEWEVDGSTIEEITPSLFSAGISEYPYPCVARAHDESWLYALMYRGNNDLALLTGRWEYIAGRTRWIWHDIRKITGITNASCAIVSSVEGRPYLYIGSTVAAENVLKVYLPVTNDATADSGYRFATSGSLWTPRYTTLLSAISKRWQEVFVRSLNLSATKYINAYYSTDDGGSFTLLGKLDTSPEQTLSFSDIEATMMNLRLDFVSNSESVVPVLKYFNLKALTLMPSVARFIHTIKCADNLLLKKNLQSNTTITAIVAFLELMRDKVCTLGDRDGNEHTVKVRIIREVEIFDEEIKRPSRLFTIEATEI